MKNLKWEFKKGTSSWCDEYHAEKFRIYVYNVKGNKDEYELQYAGHEIKRFKKLATAKKVAELIYNG